MQIVRTSCFVMTLALCPRFVMAQQSDPRPCELFSAAEIRSVSGIMPGKGNAEGPDTEEFPGATTWTCGWLVGERYFAVRVLRFSSADNAARAITGSATFLRSFPEGMQLSQVPGPGDQNWWGASKDEGAVWIARRNATVMSVILAGESKDPESLREPLRKLLASSIGKLP